MQQKVVLQVVLFVVSVLAWSTPVFCSDEAQNLRYEILDLKHTVERLEKSRGGAESQPAQPGSCCRGLRVRGLFEMELGYTALPGNDASDLKVSTIELAVDMPFSPRVLAHAMLLYEEDSTDPPELDEAMVTFSPTGASGISLAAGRLYLPFGHFDSRLVSDPLTLEVGETRETAVQIGYRSAPLHASVYAFNGETSKGGVDALDAFGFSLGVQKSASAKHAGYDLGIGWINNLADSDGLQSTIAEPLMLHSFVPGLALHATGETGHWLLITEYVGATAAFDASDLAFAGRGARVVSWNIEMARHCVLMHKTALLAVAWQESREAVALGLPRKRQLIGGSVEIYPRATLAVEWAHDEDYARAQGGRGEESNQLTAQLALLF